MFKGRDDWFDMWLADKESMLDTMVKNMASDLENGYKYFGQCIAKQREMIRVYKEDMDAKLDMFATMEEKQINKWCYFDMLKRGVIE